MKDKVKFLIIGIAVMVVVMLAGTFAWLSYRSNKTAMVLTIGDLNDAVVTLQPYQINKSIVPNTTFSENNSAVVNVEAKNNTNVNKKVRLYYKINEIDEEDFRYRISRKKDDENSFTTYKNGDFSGAVNGQNYEILNEEVPEGKSYDYKVYVWLNGASSENNQGSLFNGELRAEINTNYMKADIAGGSSNDDPVFGSNILRSTIEKVTFQNMIPNNITSADQPIDVSLNGDNSVIAYFRDSDSNSKYEMYIAANGMIIATNLRKLFNYYTNLVRIENANYLDVSQITSLRTMFQGCAYLDYIDVSTWDTSNVTDMSYMFNKCASLRTIDLSNFDTSKVTLMNSMLAGTLIVDYSSLAGFDTSNVTDMSFMFGMSSSLLKNDIISMNFLQNWDVSNVTTMRSMFQNINIDSYLPFANWNVGKVQDFNNMFHQTTGSIVTSLAGLENWNVSSAVDMGMMFEDLLSLTDASAINSWNIVNVTSFEKMFKNSNGVHPEFTRISGTWNDGTFTPNS